jgi:hypothetical protein
MSSADEILRNAAVRYPEENRGIWRSMTFTMSSLTEATAKYATWVYVLNEDKNECWHNIDLYFSDSAANVGK